MIPFSRILYNKIPSGKRDYHFFNLLILVATGLMYLYLRSGLTVIQCPYSEMGLKCATCGLTTSFISMIHGDFTEVNNNQILLFIFLMGQLIIRPFTSFLLIYFRDFRWIRNMDIGFAILFGLFTLLKWVS